MGVMHAVYMEGLHLSEHFVIELAHRYLDNGGLTVIISTVLTNYFIT